MKAFWICLCLAAIQVNAQEIAPVEFPTELTTKKGVTYRECTLKRTEADGMIIEHKAGIAKVSFFDVDESLQKQLGFDPIAAMEKYRHDKKTQRERKWKRFWDAQQHEALLESKETQKEFLETVKATWIPVQAQVHSRQEQGAFVTASRITFVETKTKSSLGFEIDGPLRKRLVPMSADVIFIKATGITGDYWRGYLEPQAYGMIQHPERKSDEVPSYRAVARIDIK